MMRWTKLLLSILFQIKSAAELFTESNTAFSRSSEFASKGNKQLMGYVVQRFDSPSFLSCGQQCLKNAWCTSTNFKFFSTRSDGGTCELNKHGFLVNDGNINLSDQLGVTFSMVLKGCLLTSCLNGGSCLPDKQKPTFSCSCKLPWIGDRCEAKLLEDAMHDLEDLLSYNSACPDDYGTVHEGSCYIVVKTRAPYRSMARGFCQHLGADLPVIRSADENEFIRKLLTEKDIDQEWGVWLGLKRSRYDNKFYWIDGTPLAGQFSAWADTEPSNGFMDNCVHTFTDTERQGKWSDNVCDLYTTDTSKIPAILCQKKL